MSPSQILQSRLQNLQITEIQIEQAKIGKVSFTESFTILQRQLLGKILYDFLPILSTLLALLLFLYNTLTNAPIGFYHRTIDCRIRILPTLLYDKIKTSL